MTKFVVKDRVFDREDKVGMENPFLKQLLHNRGLKTEAEIENFLNPSYDRHLHDPFLLHDMEKAVSRILKALERQEKIVIYSDYDCDGIPGGVVLHDFFKAVGYDNFSNYIPHRHYDGFGLSVKAVEELKEKEKPNLIITIDCGTSDLEAVTKASEQKIDVIITDHHEAKETLPEAVAVVNPKLGDTYPFTGLCGAAVVYKLVQALIARGDFSVGVGQEKWWLDMVGVATIADMVPLRDENRVLAHYGLQVLRKTRRPGLQKLLRKQRVDFRYLTEDDIGFTIGPRINAASRMDTPEDAFMLLATKDESEAGAVLEHLEKLNTKRKTAVAQMTKDLHKRLKEKDSIPEVLVMGSADWRPSLVGLAANKLAEEHKRPVFLWGKDGNEQFKGSCRSGGFSSVVTLMEEVKDLFYEFGGHHASGGFTVKEDKIHFLADGLNQAYQNLGEAVLLEEFLMVDLELGLDEINNNLLKAQKQCAPFGADNFKPVYLLKEVEPKAVEVFGKVKEHTKLGFDTKGIAKEAIAFFRLPESFTKEPVAGEKCSLLAHLEESFFMGRLQVRLRIIDVL